VGEEKRKGLQEGGRVRAPKGRRARGGVSVVTRGSSRPLRGLAVERGGRSRIGVVEITARGTSTEEFEGCFLLGRTSMQP